MAVEKKFFSRVESNEPKIEKKGKVEREKFSPEVLLDLKADKDLLLYEKAVKFLKVAGLDDANAHEIIQDETNPYSLWFLDYLEKFGKKGKPSKSEWKKISGIKQIDRMVSWKDVVYPKFKKLVKSYGFSLMDYDDVMTRAFLDGLNYPYVDTWVGLVRNVGQTSELVELNALMELNGLAGLSVESLEKRIGMAKGKAYEERFLADKERYLGPSAYMFYKMRDQRLGGKKVEMKADYKKYSDSMFDVAKDIRRRFPKLNLKINEALLAFARLEDDIIDNGRKVDPGRVGLYMQEWNTDLDDPALRHAVDFMDDWQEEMWSLAMEFTGNEELN